MANVNVVRERRARASPPRYPRSRPIQITSRRVPAPTKRLDDHSAKRLAHARLRTPTGPQRARRRPCGAGDTSLAGFAVGTFAESVDTALAGFGIGRRSHPPGAHRQPRGFQIRTRRLAPDASRVLDAAQRPPEPAQRHHCCRFVSLKALAIAAGITRSPPSMCGRATVGRRSGVRHWPALGCPPRVGVRASLSTRLQLRSRCERTASYDHGAPVLGIS